MATVNEKMTAIADKVRTLSGLEDSMSLDDMSNNLNDTCTEVDTQADLIAQITAALENKTSGGSDIDVSGVTATPSDVLAGKVFVDSTGTSQTGNIPTKTSSDLTASGATVSVPSGYYASTASKSVSTATQATPSITVSSSGLITASATQSAGYVSAGTKSGTKQLTTQAAKTITPGTTDKTIAANTYLGGVQTIKGDANLVAGNIKSGVSIFGVTGTYAGTTEDLDAVITELETKTATLNTTLEGKASGGGGSVECIYFVIEAFYSAPYGDVTGSVTYMNEANTYTTMSLDFSNSIEIEVVANSAITITIHSSKGKNFTDCSTDNDVELIYSEDNVFIVNVGSEDYSRITIAP